VFLKTKAQVMHDRGHTGKNLDRSDPRVFLERRRKCYAFPFDNPARRNWISGQIERDIRLDLPTACRPLGWRRRKRGITFGRTAIDPCGNRGDLGLPERSIVVEMAVLRIGEPRWHRFRDDSLLDCLRPRPSLFVREHRERTDLTGPMAALAILLEHGQHIFVEGDGCRILTGRGRWCPQEGTRQDEQQ
jgi:hypothetical protein